MRREWTATMPLSRSTVCTSYSAEQQESTLGCLSYSSERCHKERYRERREDVRGLCE